MEIVQTVVVVIHIIVALVIIGLVLLQHGKGADMGASFGGGSAGSLFGATGSANFLSRTTAVCAAVFFASTLALAYISNDRTPAAAGSVLDRATAPVVAPSAPATGAAQIPGSAPAVTAPAPAAGASVAASGAAAIPIK